MQGKQGSELRARCGVCHYSVGHESGEHPLPQRFICPSCVEEQLGTIRAEVDKGQKEGERGRKALAEVLDRRNRKEVVKVRREEALRRVERLRDRCNSIRDELFEGRIDAASLRYNILEYDMKLIEAHTMLEEKRLEIVTMVLKPLDSMLSDELGDVMEELAHVRRTKVQQAVKLFQVVLEDDRGDIQGMTLPRYIHSLNHGGNLQECIAITLLARLTGVVASLLDIHLPFPLEYRPSHCLIQGKPLTPPMRTSSSKIAAEDSELRDEEWMEHYRLALHMLALNVRHLALSQLTADGQGDEMDDYTRLCATNDISPHGTLRALVGVSMMRGVGRGEVLNTDYAIAEHAAFTQAQRPPPASSSRQYAQSIAVDGDLESAEWALVLPPPPSETPDF